MGALYGYLYPGPVSVYVGLYIVSAFVYTITYTVRRRNLFIASRCPDMLVWDLVSNSLVVLANGTNLIRQTEGRPFPCWIMKAVLVPFAFNIHLVTILRSMRLLWAFEKKWQWVTLYSVSARRRLGIMAIANILAFAFVILITYKPACKTDLCRADNCPWGSDWMAVWAFGMVWLPATEWLGWLLGKSRVEDSLGMRREVYIGCKVVGACMGGANIINMALDYGWITNPAVKPVPSCMALLATCVHFAITHMMPSLQLGYGPMGLMRAAMDRNNSIYADDNGSSSDNQNGYTPSYAPRMGRKKLSSSVVVPINDPPTAFNPMSLAQPTSGPHASTEAGAEAGLSTISEGAVTADGVVSSPRFEATGEDEDTTIYTQEIAHGINMLAAEQVDTFFESILIDPVKRQRLLDHARQFLVEEAIIFAIALFATRHEPRSRDNREKVAQMCKDMVSAHFEGGSMYKIDVTPAAKTLAVREVSKLLRRKVIFQDDIDAAVNSFQMAHEQLDLRIRQVVWSFVNSEPPLITPTGGPDSPAHKRRSTSRRSTSSSIGANSELFTSTRRLTATSMSGGEDPLGASRKSSLVSMGRRDTGSGTAAFRTGRASVRIDEDRAEEGGEGEGEERKGPISPDDAASAAEEGKLLSGWLGEADPQANRMARAEGRRGIATVPTSSVAAVDGSSVGEQGHQAVEGPPPQVPLAEEAPGTSVQADGAYATHEVNVAHEVAAVAEPPLQPDVLPKAASEEAAQEAGSLSTASVAPTPRVDNAGVRTTPREAATVSSGASTAEETSALPTASVASTPREDNAGVRQTTGEEAGAGLSTGVTSTPIDVMPGTPTPSDATSGLPTSGEATPQSASDAETLRHTPGEVEGVGSTPRKEAPGAGDIPREAAVVLGDPTALQDITASATGVTPLPFEAASQEPDNAAR